MISDNLESPGWVLVSPAGYWYPLLAIGILCWVLVSSAGYWYPLLGIGIWEVFPVRGCKVPPLLKGDPYDLKKGEVLDFIIIWIFMIFNVMH